MPLAAGRGARGAGFRLTARPGPAPLRVMLVDDHALVRIAVRQALTAPDVELVAEAASAEEALVLAPQVRPDVLLVDIDLPGMDGVALVRELAPRLPETRIVMLTVSSAEHDLLDAMRYGACGYLTKDVSPEALLRAVRSAYDGELAMPRRMAARLVQRLEETSRRATAAGDPALGTLTGREAEVLRLLAEGRTDREIAGRSRSRRARWRRTCAASCTSSGRRDAPRPRAGTADPTEPGTGPRPRRRSGPGGRARRRDLHPQQARLVDVERDALAVAHDEQEPLAGQHASSISSRSNASVIRPTRTSRREVR